MLGSVGLGIFGFSVLPFSELFGISFPSTIDFCVRRTKFIRTSIAKMWHKMIVWKFGANSGQAVLSAGCKMGRRIGAANIFTYNQYFVVTWKSIKFNEEIFSEMTKGVSHLEWYRFEVPNFVRLATERVSATFRRRHNRWAQMTSTEIGDHFQHL